MHVVPPQAQPLTSHESCLLVQVFHSTNPVINLVCHLYGCIQSPDTDHADAGSAVFWYSTSPSGVLDGLSLHTLCPAPVTRWVAAVQVLYQTHLAQQATRDLWKPF